jgi:hypothetical protein
MPIRESLNKMTHKRLAAALFAAAQERGSD